VSVAPALSRAAVAIVNSSLLGCQLYDRIVLY
jgi:hypothetical protein